MDKELLDKLIFFVWECFTSWDCDEDAHRYNTPCRACEAGKLLKILNEHDQFVIKTLNRV